ncbi:MAG: STAS domain-containing protein [Acidobacteriota bacterium]|jgi:anti-sigma B factor antagonist
MKIQTRTEGGTHVLQLTGKLAQPEGTTALRRVFRDLETAGRVRVVLDLRNVPWMDSSGLGEIVSCYARAQDRGGDVKLVLPEKPLSAFTFTHLEELFEIFVTPEEAVAAFGS